MSEHPSFMDPRSLVLFGTTVFLLEGVENYSQP